MKVFEEVCTIGQDGQQVSITLARTTAERERVYQFRYQVFVEEMQKGLHSVDHELRMITDELDSWSILLYAHIDQRIIGTIRISIGTIDDYPQDLIDGFNMGRFREFYYARENKKVGFSSKTMIDSQYRGSTLYYQLLARAYTLFREEGVQFVFCGTAPYLVPMYEQMGFRRYLTNFTVPEYGYMVPYVAILEDMGHARAVRSPLYRIARKYSNSNEAVAWFDTAFPQARGHLNSQLINTDELWAILSEKLGQAPNQAISMLKRLSYQEAKTYLGLGVIINAKRGEYFVSSGTVANEQYILLSGMMKVMNPLFGVDQALLEPGQSFGEIGLITSQKQTVDVIAVTDAEVLVIPRYAFEKVRLTYPRLADKIIQGIFDAPGRFYYYWPRINNNQRLATS